MQREVGRDFLSVLCYSIDMCEAKVYFKKGEDLELVMEDCISIVPQDSKLVLHDILGKSEVVEGKILQIGLLDHKVILEK